MSCHSFERFARALQWILLQKLNVNHMSILDDFIFFGPPDSSHCASGLQSCLALSHSLNIPTREDKTVLQTTIVSLHGIEIDTSLMQMRLPADKLLDVRKQIDDIYQRKKASLRQVQSLIDTRNFACKVVVAGRAFLRRVIDLTLGKNNPNHLIRLTVEARLNLAVWKLFLDNLNGVTICLPNVWSSTDHLLLYSDASLHGFAATYGRRWLQGRFPATWLGHNIAVKELFPIVLTIQMWSPLMANSRVLFMCDNMSIVAVLNSKDKFIMRLVRRLVATVQYNIHFAAKHIPGKSNTVADTLSRFQEGVASGGLATGPHGARAPGPRAPGGPQIMKNCL